MGSRSRWTCCCDPREIQARTRAGASVESRRRKRHDRRRSSAPPHPVLLERTRAAELIARPIRCTRGRLALAALDADRGGGLQSRWSPTAVAGDAWKGDGGSWVGQLTWTAGHTEPALATTRLAAGRATDALDNTADELPTRDRPGATNFSRWPIRRIGDRRRGERRRTARPPNASRVGSRTAANARAVRYPSSGLGTSPARRPQQPATGAAGRPAASQNHAGRWTPARGSTPARVRLGLRRIGCRRRAEAER